MRKLIDSIDGTVRVIVGDLYVRIGEPEGAGIHPNTDLVLAETKADLDEIIDMLRQAREELAS